MQVLVAHTLGMCFGVKDALKALDQIEDADGVTIHGELVHNETVLVQLEKRGFRMLSEDARGRTAETRQVLITAHGISDRERARFIASGKELIDTTCPLVQRVHHAALDLQRQGYFIILIGKPGHVEVRGIVEDLQEFDVVASVAAVKRYSAPRLGIICQTTVAPRSVESIRAALTDQNPDAEIRFVDTTCHPTRNRQSALDQLLPLVDAMIVIGGKNSNNTRELAELCRARRITTFHIQRADDLERAWFANVDKVGITAGTSTLDSTIEEVKERIQSWSEERPQRKAAEIESMA